MQSKIKPEDIPPVPEQISLIVEGDSIVFRADELDLYTYAKDTAGVSNCYGACAISAPPLIARDGASAVGEWSLVARKDGARQWAHRKRPVYTLDSEAGKKLDRSEWKPVRL